MPVYEQWLPGTGSPESEEGQMGGDRATMNEYKGIAGINFGIITLKIIPIKPFCDCFVKKYFAVPKRCVVVAKET